MLKQIKALGMVLVIGTMMVGCSSIEEISDTLNSNSEEIRKELDVESDNKQKTEEKKEEQKVEENKEEPVEEKKETKQQPVTYYCEWCESNTNHTSDNHIGVCYDCGIELPASQMSFDGRRFHCGVCIVAYCEECGTGLTKDSKVKLGDMMFCRPCYDIKMEQVFEEPVADCYECGTEIMSEQELQYYFGQSVCLSCHKMLEATRCANCGGHPEDSELYYNGNRYCPTCYYEVVDYSYVEPCDSSCWNCGSTNIYVHDAYGNYTCNDCGEFTQ